MVEGVEVVFSFGGVLQLCSSQQLSASSRRLFFMMEEVWVVEYMHNCPFANQFSDVSTFFCFNKLFPGVGCCIMFLS